MSEWYVGLIIFITLSIALRIAIRHRMRRNRAQHQPNPIRIQMANHVILSQPNQRDPVQLPGQTGQARNQKSYSVKSKAARSVLAKAERERMSQMQFNDRAEGEGQNANEEPLPSYQNIR